MRSNVDTLKLMLDQAIAAVKEENHQCVMNALGMLERELDRLTLDRLTPNRVDLPFVSGVVGYPFSYHPLVYAVWKISPGEEKPYNVDRLSPALFHPPLRNETHILLLRAIMKYTYNLSAESQPYLGQFNQTLGTFIDGQGINDIYAQVMEEKNQPLQDLQTPDRVVELGELTFLNPPAGDDTQQYYEAEPGIAGGSQPHNIGSNYYPRIDAVNAPLTLVDCMPIVTEGSDNQGEKPSLLNFRSDPWDNLSDLESIDDKDFEEREGKEKQALIKESHRLREQLRIEELKLIKEQRAHLRLFIETWQNQEWQHIIERQGRINVSQGLMNECLKQFRTKRISEIFSVASATEDDCYVMSLLNNPQLMQEHKAELSKYIYEQLTATSAKAQQSESPDELMPDIAMPFKRSREESLDESEQMESKKRKLDIDSESGSVRTDELSENEESVDERSVTAAYAGERLVAFANEYFSGLNKKIKLQNHLELRRAFPGYLHLPLVKDSSSNLSRCVFEILKVYDNATVEIWQQVESTVLHYLRNLNVTGEVNWTEGENFENLGQRDYVRRCSLIGRVQAALEQNANSLEEQEAIQSASAEAVFQLQLVQAANVCRNISRYKAASFQNVQATKISKPAMFFRLVSGEGDARKYHCESINLLLCSSEGVKSVEKGKSWMEVLNNIQFDEKPLISKKLLEEDSRLAHKDLSILIEALDDAEFLIFDYSDENPLKPTKQGSRESTLFATGSNSSEIQLETFRLPQSQVGGAFKCKPISLKPAKPYQLPQFECSDEFNGESGSEDEGNPTFSLGDDICRHSVSTAGKYRQTTKCNVKVQVKSHGLPLNWLVEVKSSVNSIGDSQAGWLARGYTLKDGQALNVKTALARFQNKEPVVLADSMGFGKTVQAIAVIRALLVNRQVDDNKLILILCPKSLLTYWRDELIRLGGVDKKEIIFLSGKNNHALAKILIASPKAFGNQLARNEAGIAEKLNLMVESRIVSLPPGDNLKNFFASKPTAKRILTWSKRLNNKDEVNYCLAVWIIKKLQSKKIIDQYGFRTDKQVNYFWDEIKDKLNKSEFAVSEEPTKSLLEKAEEVFNLVSQGCKLAAVFYDEAHNFLSGQVSVMQTLKKNSPPLLLNHWNSAAE